MNKMTQTGKTVFRMDFFSRVNPIKLKDPLAAALGAVEADHVFYYHYTDIVKMSGHSCPAVSGANGPISQVISNITGAADDAGFKGLQGTFSRFKLLAFETDHPPAEGLTAEAKFERMDTGQTVTVQYNSSLIPGNPEMMPLMPLVVGGTASKEQHNRFGDLWQGRVEHVLLHPPQGAFVVVS